MMSYDWDEEDLEIELSLEETPVTVPVLFTWSPGSLNHVMTGCNPRPET
jgi:hypothetical protein